MSEPERLFPLHGFILAGKAAEVASILPKIVRTCREQQPGSASQILIGGRPVQVPDDAERMQWPAADVVAFGGVMIALGPPPGLSFLRIHVDQSFPPHAYTTISLVLGTPQSELENRSQLWEFLARLYSAAEGTVGALYHPFQKTLLDHARLSSDTSGIILPQGGRVPRAPEVLNVPEALRSRLVAPEQRPYDRRLVPENVWWTNIWSETIAERLGHDRVLGAPWYRTEALDGAHLLVATEAPPIAGDTAGLESIARLIDATQLRAHQR